MGSGQYAHRVDDYMAQSRFPTMGRYRSLINLVKRAFSDSVIDDQELKDIEEVSAAILLEFQLAADIFTGMRPENPQYGAAQRLLEHLHRCNVLMTYAKAYARTVNQTGKRPKYSLQTIDPSDDMVITIGMGAVSVLALDLLEEMNDPMNRLEAQMPKIRKNLANIDQAVRIQTENKIKDMIKALGDQPAAYIQNFKDMELGELSMLRAHLESEMQRVRTE